MSHPNMPGLFHTGIIVDDLDLAMQEMGEAFGLHWVEPFTAAGQIRIPDGNAAHRASRVTYSREGPHHLELIEHVDATAWNAAPGGHYVHHIGFSVKDLPAEVRRLQSIGYDLQFSGIADDGTLARMSYLRARSGGLWIELLDASRRGQIEEWIAGGKAPH
jgi:hypothetical protein